MSNTWADVEITQVHQEWLQQWTPEQSTSEPQVTHEYLCSAKMLNKFKILHMLPQAGMPLLRVLQESASRKWEL